MGGSSLLQWKNEAVGEKALLIEGARRIGKSTLVAEFGRREYRSCLIIDFNDASDVVRDAFEPLLGDLDTFFLVLGTEYRVTLYRRDTLVVFDEVQAFPKARQAIKRLVADGRYEVRQGIPDQVPGPLRGALWRQGGASLHHPSEEPAA